MARTLQEITTDLRTRYPRLDIQDNDEKKQLVGADYDNAISTMAIETQNIETLVETNDADRTTRLAIIGRLRNNTATNDDRNRAILFILRTLRADI